MQLLNSSNRYGLVSVVIHWLVALAVFSLFGLGLWMTDLTYYSEWYRTAPSLHKSVGIVLFAVMLLRVLWRFLTPKPAPISTHSTTVRMLSSLGHGLLYLGIFLVMISGYLISTAKGRGVSVFELFEIPAFIRFARSGGSGWGGAFLCGLGLSCVCWAACFSCFEASLY